MIYLVLGRREQGKTTLATYLVQRSTAHVQVFFDPRGLIAGERVVDEVGVIAAFDRISRESDHDHVVVVTPDTNVQDHFELVTSEVQQLVRNGRSVAYVIDEMRFVDTEIDALDWLMRLAEREQTTIVFTAHRPTDVPVDVRAIADMWCLFHVTQNHDLDVIAKRCAPDVADRVRSLPLRHFVAWDDTRGTSRLVDDPKTWFVELRRPSRAPGSRVSALDEIGRDMRDKPLFTLDK